MVVSGSRWSGLGNEVKTFDRLRTSRQFRAVYDRGQRFHTPFFSAFYLSTENPATHIGLTVTRKIGGAIERNRCKRRLREAIRLARRPEAAAGGLDLVLNVKPELLTADFQRIIEAFERTIAHCAGAAAKQKGGNGCER